MNVRSYVSDQIPSRIRPPRKTAIYNDKKEFKNN